MTPVLPRRRVPGLRLRTLVVLLFDQATAERVLLPAVADLQHEIAESSEVSPPGRTFARCRAYAAFWLAVGACLLTRSDPAERAIWSRTLAGGTAVFVVLTAALMYGPLTRIGLRTVGSLAVLLLPSAMAVTIPLSVLGAGFVATRLRGGSDRRRPLVRVIAAYGIAATIVSFVVMAWTVPSANQEYRVRAYRAIRSLAGSSSAGVLPTKGYPEMTIGELRAARRDAVLHTRWQDAEHASYYLHLKGAIPSAALTFGLVALAFAPARRRPRFPILGGLLLGFATAFAYYVVMYQLRQLSWVMVVPAWFGAWAPPAIFSALALVVMGWRGMRLPVRTTNFERRTTN
jgi:hypothetical protein